jgi:hypothetical protein
MAIWFLKKVPEKKLEKRLPFPQMVLGTLDIHRWKTEARFLGITLYKSQFKMDQRPKWRGWKRGEYDWSTSYACLKII